MHQVDALRQFHHGKFHKNQFDTQRDGLLNLKRLFQQLRKLIDNRAPARHQGGARCHRVALTTHRRIPEGNDRHVADLGFRRSSRMTAHPSVWVPARSTMITAAFPNRLNRHRGRVRAGLHPITQILQPVDQLTAR